jgi:hypothetical protein
MGIRGIGILPMGVAVVAGRGARAPGGAYLPALPVRIA